MSFNYVRSSCSWVFNWFSFQYKIIILYLFRERTFFKPMSRSVTSRRGGGLEPGEILVGAWHAQNNTHGKKIPLDGRHPTIQGECFKILKNFIWKKIKKNIIFNAILLRNAFWFAKPKLIQNSPSINLSSVTSRRGEGLRLQKNRCHAAWHGFEKCTLPKLLKFWKQLVDINI